MLLLHGTSLANAERILREGYIRPRGCDPGNWVGSMASRPDCVYLTTEIAIAEEHAGWNGVIFQVDVPEMELLLDEDEVGRALGAAEWELPPGTYEALGDVERLFPPGTPQRLIQMAAWIEENDVPLLEDLLLGSQTFCLGRPIESTEIVEVAGPVDSYEVESPIIGPISQLGLP